MFSKSQFQRNYLLSKCYSLVFSTLGIIRVDSHRWFRTVDWPDHWPIRRTTSSIQRLEMLKVKEIIQTSVPPQGFLSLNVSRSFIQRLLFYFLQLENVHSMQFPPGESYLFLSIFRHWYIVTKTIGYQGQETVKDRTIELISNNVRTLPGLLKVQNTTLVSLSLIQSIWTGGRNFVPKPTDLPLRRVQLLKEFVPPPRFCQIRVWRLLFARRLPSRFTGMVLKLKAVRVL